MRPAASNIDMPPAESGDTCAKIRFGITAVFFDFWAEGARFLVAIY